MNYYDELGIKPEAGEDEIRKAHRRLVRLMHPDQHRDQAMKQLAETQMRRLNSIVATLLDTERRREYNEQLRARLMARPPVESPWRKVPWWIGSTVGAVVLTVGAVWFWADHLGSSFNSSRQPVNLSAENPSSGATNPPAANPESRPVPATRRPDPAAPSARATDVTPTAPENRATIPAKHEPSRITAAIVPSTPRDSSKKKTAPRNNPASAESAAAKPKTFDLPADARTIAVRAITPGSQQPSALTPPPPNVPGGAVSRDEVASLSMPALPAAVPPKQEPLSNGSGLSREALRSATGDSAEGEWVYAPKEPEKRKAGFYPPTFISLKLNRSDSGLRGQYSARYEVTDNKPISPDVSFQVTSVDKTSRKFTWQSSNGSRGTLAIRSIDGRTMRLEWRTTVFTGGPALTSGIATLVRREP